MTLALLSLASVVFAQDTGQGQEDTGEGQQETTSSFDVIPADEWEEAESAIQWIEGDLGAENYVIEGGVVEDADEAGVFYFATSSSGDVEGERSLSIFRYDGGWFWRLWRQDNAGDRLWHVVGNDDGKVVYLDRAGGTEVQECEEGVLLGTDDTGDESLWSVPEDNLSGDQWQESPSEYTPSDEVEQEATDRQAACEQAGQGDTGDTGTEEDAGDTGAAGSTQQ